MNERERLLPFKTAAGLTLNFRDLKNKIGLPREIREEGHAAIFAYHTPDLTKDEADAIALEAQEPLHVQETRDFILARIDALRTAKK